jgi:hypothetical protein
MWSDTFKKFGSAKDIRVDDIGMLVTENFNGTMPFRVVRKVTTTDGLVHLCVRPYDDIKRRESFMSPSIKDEQGSHNVLMDRNPSVSYNYNSYDATCPKEVSNNGADRYEYECRGHHIVLSDKASGMHNTGDVLTVNPNEVKFLKIGKFTFVTSDDDFEPRPTKLDLERSEGTLVLGSPADIDAYLFKSGMHELKVKPDSDETVSVIFRGTPTRRLNKNAALEKLIVDVGLAETDARHIVKHAKINEVVGLVKFGAPMAQPAAGNFDSTYGTVVKQPESESFSAGGAPAPSPQYEDEAAQMPGGAQSRAMQAAESGQKDVFDISILEGLIRISDVGDLLQDMLKNIILGNDRVGRILFTYYWHFDKFTEIYGDQEMKELEDTLRNVFKSTGDLILFLKRRSIDPGVGSESVIDLDGAPGPGI